MNKSFIGRVAGLMTGPALFLFSVVPLRSHDPITTRLTWTQEISRIVYKRCAGCHRPGGSAFPLTTYEDARPWAKGIRDEVTSRRMPPWGAVQGIGDFLDDPGLSGPEREMLVLWVEGGAPEGDPAYLPHRVPASAPPRSSPPGARKVEVSHQLTLKNAAVIVGFRPENLPEGGALEAWAMEPDGRVQRLIWLRDYRKRWNRDYIPREPLVLRPGTKLKIEATARGAMLFYLRQP